MEAANKKELLDDFAERLLKGLRKSNYKLIIETAAQNSSLVIGDSKEVNIGMNRQTPC